jgi:hypothetical protein
VADIRLVSEQRSTAKPGWYPNPEGEGLRLWNGRGWSGLSADAELIELGSGGRLQVRAGNPEVDYSYQAVSRLNKRRRPPLEHTLPPTP